MNEIEPGCKAIFIYSKSHPELIDTECTVIRPSVHPVALILVDSPWVVSTQIGEGFADEKQLMRIDGEEEKEEMECRQSLSA